MIGAVELLTQPVARLLRMLPLTLALTLLSGCLAPRVSLDNAQILMDREDFQAAAQAAPEWTRAALKTINQLEQQIEER